MLRRIIAFAVLLAAASPAAARDSLGNYVSVGFGKCPEFLKDMATAKQRGGAETSAGLVVMANYISYVQGFRTAFNAEAEGIVDILSSMGKDSVVNALYTIERWCTQNPDKDFADAVIFLTDSLRDKLKKNDVSK
jgi:hypothetical protein